MSDLSTNWCERACNGNVCEFQRRCEFDGFENSQTSLWQRADTGTSNADATRVEVLSCITRNAWLASRAGAQSEMTSQDELPPSKSLGSGRATAQEDLGPLIDPIVDQALDMLSLDNESWSAPNGMVVLLRQQLTTVLSPALESGWRHFRSAAGARPDPDSTRLWRKWQGEVLASG
jgi:hypothetical protein